MNTTNANLQHDCTTCTAHMADLLLDPGYTAAHPEFSAHIAACSACRTELNELRATFAMLDEYTAPEPSTWFDSRLHARLREAQSEQPEGFFARFRAFLLYSTGRSFQPALAAALAVVLAVGGGGTFWQMHNTTHATPAPTASAAVNDLNVLDNNAQAEQQMGQLLDQSGAEDQDEPPTS